MSSSQGRDRREVNQLLHTLRGEQFRHQQNLRRSRAHLSASHTHNVPSLPPGLIAQLNHHADASTLSRPAEKDSANCGSWSGPSPPKSWIKGDIPLDPYNTPAWRQEAFTVLARHIYGFINPEKVLPLSVICLRAIVSRCSNVEELEDLLMYVPQHIRRDLIRYQAIHSPLSEWKLNALFYPGRHVDGEIIVVGPKAGLREDHFFEDHTQDDSQESDWESEEHSHDPLRHLILVSTRLSTSLLLTLPPTLTHIALLRIPTSIPLPRLTKLCPLLTLLDLSFNRWLHDQVDADENLGKVDWSRWSHLRVLGLRECFVPEGLLHKINNHRWDDVELIQ